MNTYVNKLNVLPCVALRGLVVYPHMLLHFDVGRDQSVAALRAAMEESQDIFVTAQKDVRIDNPSRRDLYTVGTVCAVMQVVTLPGDAVRVVVEGKYRASISKMVAEKPFLLAAVTRCREIGVKEQDYPREEALIRTARRIFESYAAYAPKLSNDIAVSIMESRRAGDLADYIASNIPLAYPDKQALLALRNPLERLEELCRLLLRETDLMKMESAIEERVHEQMDKSQRDYYLRERIRAISEELDESDDPRTEGEQYRERVLALHLPEKAETKLLKDCEHLYKMAPGSQEGTVLRNYLDTCLGLPWNVTTQDNLDLTHARKVLDSGHSGMDRVKERILESLAVRSLAPDITGQILCLVGPPGVGKTSIAKSVARAMGRKYARISLGGVRDEAEIRGHRKTYIGAMPGRILNAVKQAGSANAMILLDEVDKLGADHRGDPSAALLEVLDAEQNQEFVDHYLEIPFDLSKVFFLTTANDASSIPAPLYDRMEIIELPSYTHEEKFTIAKAHLLPKQEKRHGLKRANIRMQDQALHLVIDGYTREAGVRTLERQIARICRKAAVKVAAGGKSLSVTPSSLEALLGPRRYKQEIYSLHDETGVVNGLAWTSVGGVLMPIEVAVLEGKGELKLTGSLGDVMKESAQTAVSVVRSRCEALGIQPDFYKTKDIHIHAPEGAVPKDGPSAGVTMVTALVSALTGRPVRADIAMTGEVSLRGRVLPIGGLREKSMAAYRAGIRNVIIPADNLPDLEELDAVVKEKVRFFPVNQVDQVFRYAFRDQPKAVSAAGAVQERRAPSGIGQGIAQ